MEGWKETTLSEIIEIIGGGTPKTKIKEYWNGDIPWLSVVDFNTGRKYVYDTEKKITEKGLNSSSTKLLNKGDIIISARGTVGVVAMLGNQMAFNQSCYGIRANPNFSTNEYVFYLLKDTIENFIRYAHGGVFNTITRSTFKEIELSLPPLPEQRAIASVLSSLDDKIDLLHRQNQTLEEMAETLFRQWFDGLNLKSTLKDVISIKSGYAFKNKSFIGYGNQRVLKIKNISDKVVDVENSDFVSSNDVKNLDDKFLIKEGDILFAMTGAKIGKMGIVPKSEDNLWLNQRVALFREKYYGSKYLVYLHLKSEYGLDYIENTATGSAQPNISASGIENCEFPKLSEKKLTEYSEQLAVFYKKVIFNLGQIRTLTQLRDTLLPKLMSGEVRVKQ